MNSKNELVRQKYQNALDNLKNHVPTAGKISELENLQGYLDTVISDAKVNQDAKLRLDELDKEDLTQLQKIRGEMVTEIAKTKDDIAKQSRIISQKDREIHQSEVITDRQKREIDYKKNLVLTRDRMLELSQEKNIYKKKVIYSLIAVVIFVILLMILSFYYITRK